MFRKRVRKEFPPGTFISTPARVMAILQLCLAFTVIAWHAGEPFLGDLFNTKSKLVVYQFVMGTKNEDNAARFAHLPEDQREHIQQNYDLLQKQYNLPFWDKLKRSGEIILFGIPAFELAWIALSIFIPIMLLKRVDGAVAAVWLLPFVTLFYAIDNRWYGKPQPAVEDAGLFPSEELIVKNYLKEPLSQHVNEQQKQLMQGWEFYLVKEWARETPSANPDTFKKQKEDGEFAFNVARLDYLKPTSLPAPDRQQTRVSYYLLGLYLFWNMSFAFVVKSFLTGRGGLGGQSGPGGLSGQ